MRNTHPATYAEPDCFADANGHAATNTDAHSKPDRNAFTDAGSGLEHLDPVAG